MASHIWIGGAPAVAQVDTVTFPSDVAAGQVVNMVIGLKTLSVTLTGTTQAEIISEVVVSWNTSTIPEFSEVAAAIGSIEGTMALTAKTAGKPFAVTTSIGSGNNEIQVITLSGTDATGGTFTLTFDGQTTGDIAYNASAATIETALEALSKIGVGDTTVSGSAGGPWTVEFTGALAVTNVALMTIDVTNLTGGVNEIQTISSPSNPTGGTFTLSYGGDTTSAIAYNASAATIQTALEALNTIPVGSVACTGGALPGTPVTVTFQDELATTDVDLLVADASSLTGVTGSVTETTQGGGTLKDKTLAYWDFGSVTPPSSNYYSDSTIFKSLEPYDLLDAGTHAAAGILGNCLYNDGGLDNWYVNDSNFAAFDEDEPFSLSAWVKFDSVAWTQDIIVRELSSFSSTNADFYLRLYGGFINFERKKATGYHSVTSIVSIATNTWYHIAAVYDPTNTAIKLSVNGAAFEEATGLSVGGLSAGSTSSDKINVMSGAANRSFYGFIDGVGIFNDVLTIGEVGDLYNSGSGDDYPFPNTSDNEVQTLSLIGSPTAGSVTVSYQGVGVDIPYDATAAEAEALLDTVSTIGAGNVNVTGGDWPGTALVVEFINDLAATNVELLEIDTSALTMAVAETIKGVTAPVGSVATTVSPMTSTTSTASEGPNHWDTAANWNSNTVPVSSDTVYISDTDTSILYGLEQTAVTLAALHVEQNFSGEIGLPRLNSDAAASYFEYRDTYLKIGATNLYIGDKEGDGSERIKINLGSVQTTALITDSGDSPDGNTPAILLLGTHTSNVININRGSLGVAYYPTEVSTIATLRQAFFDDATDDTNVYLGADVTITDIIKTGGVLDINSGTTTFKQTAGTTTIHAGAHAVLNILDGLVNYNSIGTLSIANLSGESVLVFDQDARPKTVTIINKFTDDSEIYDVSGSIATPVIDLENCGDLSTLHMGQDFKVTIGATT